jgi:hypothetical protein
VLAWSEPRRAGRSCCLAGSWSPAETRGRRQIVEKIHSVGGAALTRAFGRAAPNLSSAEESWSGVETGEIAYSTAASSASTWLWVIAQGYISSRYYRRPARRPV